MTDTITKAAERLILQKGTMRHAIELLQKQIDDMTSTTDPETAGWIDVGRYAHAAEAAQRLINEIGE